MAERTFFGTLRIAILLAVLLFVATGAWLDRRRSTDWDSTLRVTVYPVAVGDAAAAYVDALAEDDFDVAEDFLRQEARRYGIGLAQPVRLRLSRAAPVAPPAAPAEPGLLSVVAWSLRFRYWAWRVSADDPLPPPDVQILHSSTPRARVAPCPIHLA